MRESNPFRLGDQLLIMESHEQAIRNRLGIMQEQRFVERFWEKDARLWKREPGDNSIVGAMGWLRVADTMRERIPELRAFAQEIQNGGFERVVLCGMGGSSLAPLVLSEVLGKNREAKTRGESGNELAGESGHNPRMGDAPQAVGAQYDGLPLSVLDSTDPDTVLRIQREGPLDKTLFIIASKSGSTAEPNAFDDYFYDQVSKVKANPGENFVAITDPGTQMEQIARDRKFRKTFLNFADIGGRFSALSYFGMLPAALMGLDLDLLLSRAVEVIRSNAADQVSGAQPAFALGAALGELALLGKDKLTFIMPAALDSLGLWLEQLVAESTGKEGKGILPVAGEQAGAPSEYGDDRVFVYLRPEGEDCTFLDMRCAPLRDSGKPIVWIALNNYYDVAREFMRWEIATAVAGSVIGINPFDQPNVQEAKDVTKRIIAQVEEQGALPKQQPDASFEGVDVYGEVKGNDLETCFCEYLAEAKPGDFVTLMAYLTESPEMTDALSKLQRHIRDNTGLATTKGYGPRFLHSTGQYHKGGPNKGHFIQLTKNDQEDAKLPGKKYTFGMFRNAQALGDKETLEKHGRRVIRIHLGDDPLVGVSKLQRVVEAHPTVVKA